MLLLLTPELTSRCAERLKDVLLEAWTQTPPTWTDVRVAGAVLIAAPYVPPALLGRTIAREESEHSRAAAEGGDISSARLRRLQRLKQRRRRRRLWEEEDAGWRGERRPALPLAPLLRLECNALHISNADTFHPVADLRACRHVPYGNIAALSPKRKSKDRRRRRQRRAAHRRSNSNVDASSLSASSELAFHTPRAAYPSASDGGLRRGISSTTAISSMQRAAGARYPQRRERGRMQASQSSLALSSLARGAENSESAGSTSDGTARGWRGSFGDRSVTFGDVEAWEKYMYNSVSYRLGGCRVGIITSHAVGDEGVWELAKEEEETEVEQMWTLPLCEAPVDVYLTSAFDVQVGCRSNTVRCRLLRPLCRS